MERVYNFSAGPAMLPTAVLKTAQAEFLDYHEHGMNCMETSHRSDLFLDIIARSENSLRTLLSIPDNYHCLFLQGGASAQFSMIPLNLLAEGQSADYVNTGIWSKKAIAEAKRYGKVRVVADSSADKFNHIPDYSGWDCDPNAAYLHYTPNETIGGLEFQDIPAVSDAPLVADMSSNILSRPLDVSRFGLIYAGAQKNIGPAGLTLVIVRDDLLGNAQACAPTLFNYQTLADNGSMYNTPATYSWYLAGLVFDWLLAEGGVDQMAVRNQAKAEALYQAIDNSDFYANPIKLEQRSWMNVPFTLADSELDGRFLEEADKRGLANLAGHRSVGGMRASIYNAMPVDGVTALVDFMTEFEQRFA